MNVPEKRKDGESNWREHFRKFSHNASQFSGSPWVFCAACLIVIGWAASGPAFRFSDTWQLVINTGTTIVTFLMVFLIQNTQNRDTRAMHLKLDELIRALKGARNQLVNLEEMSDEDLDRLQKEFQRVSHERDSQRRDLQEEGPTAGPNGGKQPLPHRPRSEDKAALDS